jgi:hypothetical protein
LFDNAVNQRQRAFGQNRRLIGDVPRGAMAASFVEHLGARSASGRPGLFVTPPGLELSAVAERGSAILLAWEAGAAPVKPINQFSPRRTRRDTLWRLAMNF